MQNMFMCSRTMKIRCYTRPHATVQSHLPWHIVVDLVVDAQLLADDIGQTGAVAQVYPVADAAALLCVLAFLHDDPVEALGPRDGRAEPDLLVGRLLVEHVAELLGDVVDAEHTGLLVSANAPHAVCTDLCVVTHRVFDLNVRVGLLLLLEPLDQLVQVVVGALVELGRRDVGWHRGRLLESLLRLLGRRVLGIGHDAACTCGAVEAAQGSSGRSDSCRTGDDAIDGRRCAERGCSSAAERQ